MKLTKEILENWENLQPKEKFDIIKKYDFDELRELLIKFEDEFQYEGKYLMWNEYYSNEKNRTISIDYNEFAYINKKFRKIGNLYFAEDIRYNTLIEDKLIRIELETKDRNYNYIYDIGEDTIKTVQTYFGLSKKEDNSLWDIIYQKVQNKMVVKFEANCDCDYLYVIDELGFKTKINMLNAYPNSTAEDYYIAISSGTDEEPVYVYDYDGNLLSDLYNIRNYDGTFKLIVNGIPSPFVEDVTITKKSDLKKLKTSEQHKKELSKLWYDSFKEKESDWYGK